MEEIILKTKDLTVDFPVKNGLFRKKSRLSAVHKVNLEIRKGEIYGLVGESGCGKTTLANALLGFVPITGGSFEAFGQTITPTSPAAHWQNLRPHFQTVFQDPYSSLNSRLPIWQLISEPMYIAGERNNRILWDRAAALVEQVGLGKADLNRYVFEFSGGQRQRVAIARALCAHAKLIICDEPTSALDVSVQSQICNLLLDLREAYGLTYLFISHNLSLIRHMTDHTTVMYLGEVMESGPTGEIFAHPQMPYTKALISAIPQIYDTGRERIILSGEASSPIDPPDICRFAPRCPCATDVCHREPPDIHASGNHLAKCHFCHLRK